MTREELSELDKRIAASVARQEAAIARYEAVSMKSAETCARHEAATAKYEEISARIETEHVATIVRYNEISARIETEHAATIARYDEISARIAARMEEREAKLEQREEEAEDLKTFIRNMNLRTEKLIQAFDRHAAEFFAKQEKRDDRLAAETRESREESRAQTQALLRLIDRFPPPPPTSAQ